MSTTCIFGCAVDFDAAFTDAIGVAGDPTTVLLRLTQPDGEHVFYDTTSMTNPSAGVYAITIALSIVGDWGWVWIGYGAPYDVVAQDNGTIVVTGVSVG